MSRLEVLGYIFVFVSMTLSRGLYKLEIRKSPIDKKHEYIKKHRIFGSLTKLFIYNFYYKFGNIKFKIFNR